MNTVLSITKIMDIKSIELENSNPNTETQLHLLNCRIENDKHEDLPAEVKSYFSSQMKFEKNEKSLKNPIQQHLKATFRGRPMDGKCVQLPANYKFARLCKSSNDDNKLIASDLTNKVTYWNLDKIPSSNDSIPQILQWLQLSSDIHSHVQLEN